MNITERTPQLPCDVDDIVVEDTVDKEDADDAVLDIVLEVGFDVEDVMFKFVGSVVVFDVVFVGTVGCKMESKRKLKYVY